jgi:uncharacterized membrane protein HdeD (DUF308 family)
MERTIDKSLFVSISGKVIGLGAVLGLIGLLFVVAPEMLGLAVGTVAGVLLILLGVIRGLFAWIASTWGAVFLRFLLALLALVAGVLIISDPERGRAALTIVVAVFLVADGLSQIFLSLPLRPVGGIWLMLSGIASVVISLIIWQQWPASGEWALGILVGAKLLVDGLGLIGVGSVMKAVSN